MGKRLAKKIFKKGGSKPAVETEKEQEVIPVPETKKKRNFIPPPPSVEED